MGILTVEKVIEIHQDIVADFGGEPGIRDPATLEFVVYEANRKKTVIRRAATALFGICTGHPFVDGNKRTAFVISDNLLKDEGYWIATSDEAVVAFMLEVAQYRHTKESVEKWIQENIFSQAA